RFSFEFDLMADERGRIPLEHIMPWKRGSAALVADPGVIAHLQSRFEGIRLERVRGLRSAFDEALATQNTHALSCLDDLCYGRINASLAWYVAHPRITIELDAGELVTKAYGLAAAGGSRYELDTGEELVLAERAEPGPMIAGPLCRASADRK